ncbi:MAG TPA: SPW repeat protein [Polyangia bacterium]
MGARSMNASIGFWLFLSAFLWPHSRAQVVNAWVIGMLTVTIALAGLGSMPRSRYLNVVLGAWLIVSTMVLRGTGTATVLNDVIVGAALTVFGAVRRIGHPPEQQVS